MVKKMDMLSLSSSERNGIRTGLPIYRLIKSNCDDNVSREAGKRKIGSSAPLALRYPDPVNALCCFRGVLTRYEFTELVPKGITQCKDVTKGEKNKKGERECLYIEQGCLKKRRKSIKVLFACDNIHPLKRR